MNPLPAYDTMLRTTRRGVSSCLILTASIDTRHTQFLTSAFLQFWVNPFGVAFSLINKSDLILVNHGGQVIDGGECRLLNTAAYMIHAAVHAARPDVMCAAHSHSIYGRTWSVCLSSSPLSAAALC